MVCILDDQVHCDQATANNMPNMNSLMNLIFCRVFIVMVRLCTYVLLFFLFWIAVWPFCGKVTVHLASICDISFNATCTCVCASFPLVSWIGSVR